MLTSPLVRTWQTAEVVADDVRPEAVDRRRSSRCPRVRVTSRLAKIWQKHSRRSRIALVGHEPGIGELAARLAGVRQPVEFKKGAICRIDVETLPPDDESGSASVVPDTEDPAKSESLIVGVQQPISLTSKDLGFPPHPVSLAKARKCFTEFTSPARCQVEDDISSIAACIRGPHVQSQPSLRRPRPTLFDRS